jgi:hypothetical protein
MGTPALGRLRDALVDARAAGRPFEDVWIRAVRDCKPDNLTRSLLEDDDVRAAWHRAYDRAPATPAEAAVARLTVLFERAGVDAR